MYEYYLGRMRSNPVHVPIGIVLYYFSPEGRLLRVFLVPDFQASYIRNCFRFERYEILVLQMRVYVLYNNIDRFSNIALFKICMSHKVDISEDLRRSEIAWEDLVGRKRISEVGVGESQGRYKSQTDLEGNRRSHHWQYVVVLRSIIAHEASESKYVSWHGRPRSVPQ